MTELTAMQAWLVMQRDARKRSGLTRVVVDRSTHGGVIDLAGNDYLGLARHPRLRDAVTAAVAMWGVGATASRLVSGTTPVHSDAERQFAEFAGWPAALLFSSGYLANLAVVTALGGSEVLVISDAHVHASLVDACRLSRSPIQVVPHSDVTAVRRALAERTQPRAMVLCESVYSVLGDAAPLAEFAALCTEHDAVLLVDEAHALGVAGPQGRGLVAAHGLSGRPEVIVTGTLSKAFGGQGGLVLADASIRDHLINTARPFIYDTGLAPALAEAALAALTVIAEEPGLLAEVHKVAATFAAAVGVPLPASAVLSVPMPSPNAAVDAVAWCANRGVRVGCFRPPSVPDGVSRLRVTASARLTLAERAHAQEVLSAACEIFR
ncbi:MAG: 8-amino-7-oxononanoate synthase [Actinomycetota bacterium]